MTQTRPEAILVLSVSQTCSNSSSPTWQPLHNNKIQSTMNNTDENNLTSSNWRPHDRLPHRSCSHLLFTSITHHDLKKLVTICQHEPTIPILCRPRNTGITMTVEDLQDLVSYGTSIGDSIVTLYMELLCSTYNICYLPMDFILRLKQHGWKEVQRFFSQPNRNNRKRSICRPNLQKEKTIIIPAFIHNSHWVALVRHNINGTITFYYSDDMNNCNDEENLRTLIQTQTCKEFCPASAIWINCASNYCMTHSNECGPRTILACHVMATHPSPFKEMLFPLMHTNLAQIARTWITSTLVSGRIIHSTLDPIYNLHQYPDTHI